jgi:hypothetical protein
MKRRWRFSPKFRPPKSEKGPALFAERARAKTGKKRMGDRARNRGILLWTRKKGRRRTYGRFDYEERAPGKTGYRLLVISPYNTGRKDYKPPGFASHFRRRTEDFTDRFS